MLSEAHGRMLQELHTPGASLVTFHWRVCAAGKPSR